jgi:hypothetical protein
VSAQFLRSCHPRTIASCRATPHNLDKAALRPAGAGEPATLGYFMRDHVEHLSHHLRQIAEQSSAG